MDEVVLSGGDPPSSPSRWRAELRLRYAREGARTVLCARRHVGPLVVQKSLYPEGEAVCQNIVVHPPGGIAGGDVLTIEAILGDDALVQLTTPGAAKWYRSGGQTARQTVVLKIGAGAVLEWLPQESIVFNGAVARLDVAIDLAPTAVYVGWEIVCLGRTASGERFDQGELRQQVTLAREGKLLFAERLALAGGGPALASPVCLNRQPVFGTFLAAAPTLSDAMLAVSRDAAVIEGEGAATRLPGLIVARYRGASCEAARDYFASLWTRLRPMLSGRDAVYPRIWKT